MIPKVIIFDLDGTLAVSKSPLTKEMATLLAKLTNVTNVAVISGGALPQFLIQIVEQLPSDARVENLYLLPTSGASLYRYQHFQWIEVYVETLSEKEARMIDVAIRDAAEKTGYIDFLEPSHGERIEFRGSQVTLSALGQHAPVREKEVWDPDHKKRRALQELISAQLPEFSVKIGGMTSIDITKQGIDKAYGVRKLSEVIAVPISDMLYVGDALFPDGNDEIVKETGIPTQQVSGPADTKEVIEKLLSE